ncbi:NMT1/THI5 like protein [Oxobacter pfennigii]|uniref:NMT1/THI5 like protein n=1 Tax=Oxobacter pfennigii TaxID=36849 RepID=A0A0P9AB05_9CLOT|nr:ABC transporter substrate-binding protein [Oxobacter pfennigii]KPU42227.1 NMT1/THI5 like protein [Oxobacter pfennigii]
MRKIKLTAIILIIITLIVSLFSGCTKAEQNKGDTTPTPTVAKSPTSEPVKLTKIRLNEVVRSIFYAPMYAAINEGFFEEEGFEIELSTGQGADKTMQQVLSKNADIGFCGPEQVIYLYNQGREDYTVVFAQLTKRDGSFLVGRTPETDFKWESLKGKTLIGGRPGGVPQMTLEYVIRQHGLDPLKDVEFITNLDFTATHSAFRSGMGDYVALFEPTATVLEDQGAGSIVASIGKDSGEIPYTCFFATKSYMESNPETIQKFTNALYKGMLWVESHTPEEIADSVKSFFPGSDAAQLAKVVKRYKDQDAWSKDLILSEESLNRLCDVIKTYKADLLPQIPPFENVVDNKFAIQAGKN